MVEEDGGGAECGERTLTKVVLVLLSMSCWMKIATHSPVVVTWYDFCYTGLVSGKLARFGKILKG
jgi:hypothetical protein